MEWNGRWLRFATLPPPSSSYTTTCTIDPACSAVRMRSVYAMAHCSCTTWQCDRAPLLLPCSVDHPVDPRLFFVPTDSGSSSPALRFRTSLVVGTALKHSSNHFRHDKCPERRHRNGQRIFDPICTWDTGIPWYRPRLAETAHGP